MRTIAGIFLALLSLFSGGCSVLFVSIGFAGIGGFLLAAGFLVAALAGWGALVLLAEPTPSPSAPPSRNVRNDPDDDHLP